ncbi:SAM-dependent methyltransferase [Nonomuraea turkmeniaca]|uniref:SAM-dependent methyltransferase n=1 Tax=Nonomuraea turkmeniaca TaxID=103838 RepID=A0A5S4F1T0_9ACTN|nr:SAM-dependent methyltransferase [Nonomuraea turkmeniaca]
MTAADISRLAGVTRATVSNWRRRHADFPLPSGGTDASPLYDRAAVEAWLSGRGQLPATSPVRDLRTFTRDPNDLYALSALLLPLLKLSNSDRRALDDLADAELIEHARMLVGRGHADLTLRPALVRSLTRATATTSVDEILDTLLEVAPDASARGTYLTPEPVADLMAALLAGNTYPGAVFDPACGTGGLLLAAARRGATRLFGQDVSPVRANQAAVRIRVSPIEADADIRTGDSLRADAFSDLTAEGVLCNPPYADRDWGHEELGYDARWEHGVPPKGESELAWVQHCLAHLEYGGLAVILLPPAVAERPSGRKIRAELIRHSALRAVVALPSGVAPPLHIGLHLWILQRPLIGRADAPPFVLFIDAGLDRDTIVDVWRDYADAPKDFTAIPGVARAVPALELIDVGVDLTPGRHVRRHTAAEPLYLADAAAAARLRLRRAIDALAAMSSGAEWKATGAQASTWRTATIADLVRGGAVGLHKAAMISRDKRSTSSAPEPEGGGVRVLTAGDVAGGRAASGRVPDSALAELLPLRRGDVVLPEILDEGSSLARVVDDDDAATVLGPNLHLIRPDLERLDPWFLAGFLSAEDNLNATSTGTTIVRVDARKLRIPLMPLTEQRRYGRAFRRMAALRKAADLAVRLAEETARQHVAGLTSGALLPPGE